MSRAYNARLNSSPRQTSRICLRVGRDDRLDLEAKRVYGPLPRSTLKCSLMRTMEKGHGAYAILAGGGMKGVALAGCLSAAEGRGIGFEGYGGTSAGALIALLASVGYSPDELRKIFVDELDYTNFFDDEGDQLEYLRQLPSKCDGIIGTGLTLARNAKLLWNLKRTGGLYEGDEITKFIVKMVGKFVPGVDKNFTFDDLLANGCLPLKVVTTNVTTRRAQVHSGLGGKDLNGPVCTAIRASMCYPFVFRPIRIDRDYLVDGGVASNLPVFLFERERRKTGAQVIAFDLLRREDDEDAKRTLASFCGDLIGSALQASDLLLRESIKEVVYVGVNVPASADALKLGISKADREVLFEFGYAQTTRALNQKIPQLQNARDRVEQLQSTYEIPPAQMRLVLRSMCHDFERQSRASDLRAYVLLPSDAGKLATTYQFGMDGDVDASLEATIDNGWCGSVFRRHEPIAFDPWVRLQLDPSSQEVIRRDRRALLAVPLFDLSPRARDARHWDDLPVIGVLAIDSSTPIDLSGWVTNYKDPIEALWKQWSSVVSRLLA